MVAGQNGQSSVIVALLVTMAHKPEHAHVPILFLSTMVVTVMDTIKRAYLVS